MAHLRLLFGPLAAVIAVDPWWRKEVPHPHPELVGPPEHHSDRVDLLAGFDGSPESDAAIAWAVELLGPRLGRLKLATVIPYEADPSVQPHAMAALRELADRYAGHRVGTEVLEDYPSKTLAQAAAAGGYDLVVIGTRGRGLSRRMLGSAASGT